MIAYSFIIVFVFCVFCTIGFSLVFVDAYQVWFSGGDLGTTKGYTLENNYEKTTKSYSTIFKEIDLNKYVYTSSKWRVGFIEHRNYFYDFEVVKLEGIYSNY